MIGITLVIVSSICFAVVPNSAKMALDDGASLFFLLMARFIIGAVLLLPIMVLTKSSMVVTRQHIPKVMVTSVMALGLLVATYHAVDFIDIGLVLLILYSFPIGVALLAQIKGREKLSRARWLCMVMVLVGLAVMIYDGQGDINSYGILVSVLGLICFVFFIETSSDLVMVLGAKTLNFYISLFGLAVMIGVWLMPEFMRFGLMTSEFIPPETPIGAMSVGLNGVFYIVSWVLFFEGARIVGATRASLMACVEPLFAALLALAVLGQHLSAVEWAGFFIVLGAIYGFERLRIKQVLP